MTKSDSRNLIAAISGIALGVATLNAGPISSISANRILSVLQEVLVIVLLPGLFTSAMTGSLLPGAFVNLIVGFGLAWLTLYLVQRARRSSAVDQTRPDDSLT